MNNDSKTIITVLLIIAAIIFLVMIWSYTIPFFFPQWNDIILVMGLMVSIIVVLAAAVYIKQETDN